MNDIYLPHFYSAESVTEGHPDKLCDQIADAVLDGCLALDRNARVACEVAATQGHIFLMGEITASARPNEAEIAREVLRHVGYDPKDYEIHTLIHPQSPDIEAAVNDPLDTGADPDAIGAGDQCVVVGYGRMFSLWMYAAIAPIPLSTFAGEPTSSVGKNFLRSYAGVCLQGVVIALACIIFSALATSAPTVDPNASAITAVWSYVGSLAFNLLVLVGAVKGCDRIVKEIMGL